MSDKDADKPWPTGPGDGPEVVERYGPGEGDVILWDTTSNFARIRAMRLEGKTVPQISASLELPISTVKQSLTNQVKMESAKIDGNEIATILQLEMERLDHLFQGYWFAAGAGDIDAAKVILSIGKERREWLKWAQPEPTAEIGITNNILVVGGTEAEFLKQLETARTFLKENHGEGVVDVEVVGDGEPDDEE